ncbi:hypothetical protein QBC39DRAFT_150088 [Podospora conica]|nr:hypothetical protein QBC39DRAFT_150088 [Schizothecium conicum]
MLDSARIAGRTLFAHQPASHNKQPWFPVRYPEVSSITRPTRGREISRLSGPTCSASAPPPPPLPWVLQGTHSGPWLCRCGGFGACCQVSMVLSAHNAVVVSCPWSWSLPWRVFINRSGQCWVAGGKLKTLMYGYRCRVWPSLVRQRSGRGKTWKMLVWAAICSLPMPLYAASSPLPRLEKAAGCGSAHWRCWCWESEVCRASPMWKRE